MRQRNLVQRIRDAVRTGKIKEPFKSSDFSFLRRSPNFISKHALDNGKYSEYFIRVERGLYKLK